MIRLKTSDSYLSVADALAAESDFHPKGYLVFALPSEGRVALVERPCYSDVDPRWEHVAILTSASPEAVAIAQQAFEEACDRAV